MPDDYYYYKDQVSELQATNNFIRSNTIRSILAKIENVKKDRDLKGLSNSGVDEIIILIEEML
jgi:hypothetical protein